MTGFFAAIVLVFSGGFLPLFLWRHFSAMKLVGALAMGAGCLIGLVDAVTQLFLSGGAAVGFNYLNALSLSFQIDTLSAFFLMAIFAVSMLAALYSYHYLDQPEKALRTASSYLFFSLLVVSLALVVTAANLITFMLSWEIMSLSSFFLVIFNYESSENGENAVHRIILCRFDPGVLQTVCPTQGKPSARAGRFPEKNPLPQPYQ
jgi:hydrogenase-4 component B